MGIYIYICVAVLSSCSNLVGSASQPDLPTGVTPVSVNLSNGTANEIVGYSAKVLEFRGDSRNGSGMSQTARYALSVRLIDGVLHTRMDMPAVEVEGLAARTILNDGTKMVTLSPAGEVLSRSPLPVVPGATSAQKLDRLFARVDVVQISDALQRMNFRTEPGSRASQTKFVATTETLAQLFQGRDVLAYQITLDGDAGAVTGVEITEALDADETVKTTTTPLFQVVGGVPVSIGTLTESLHTFKSKQEVNPATVALDPSTVPTISREQLAQWEAEGRAVHSIDPPKLDPTSKNYTQTSLVYHEQMTLNATPESLFRIPGGL